MISDVKKKEDMPYSHQIRLEVQAEILKSVKGITLEKEKTEDFGAGENAFRNKLIILLERK